MPQVDSVRTRAASVAFAAGGGEAWSVGLGRDRSGGCRGWAYRSNAGRAAAVRMPDRNPRDVAVGAGAVWVVGSTIDRRCRASGEFLARIDPERLAVVATIRLDQAPDAGSASAERVAVGPSGVWVAVRHGVRAGEILRVDPRTNSVVGRLSARGVPGDIALAGGAVWFLSDREWTDEAPAGVSLHRLDPRRNRIVATPLRARLDDLGGSEVLPRLVAGRDALWLSHWSEGSGSGWASGQVSLRVDAVTNEVEARPIPHRSFSPVAATGGEVWFVGRRGLSSLDAQTLKPRRGPLELRVAPVDASFDRLTGTLWIRGYDSPQLLSIDLAP